MKKNKAMANSFADIRDWFYTSGRDYIGEWVVFEKGRLLAHAPRFFELKLKVGKFTPEMFVTKVSDGDERLRPE